MRCQIGIREMSDTFREIAKADLEHAKRMARIHAKLEAEIMQPLKVRVEELLKESHNATPTQHETATSAENTDETDS